MTYEEEIPASRIPFLSKRNDDLKPIDGSDLESQIIALRESHPHLYECLDLDLVTSWQQEIKLLDNQDDDFGPDASGGRGDHYVSAQTSNVMARAHGINQLLGFMNAQNGRSNCIVLDLLGGDGLLRKVAAHLGLSGIEILSCDISKHMITAAWGAGAPAILQRAERLLFRNSSVDGVLLAYGTHHIDPANRLSTVREAQRVLRPGGVFVLHDFEVGSPMDEWFSKVVNQFSITGHPFKHFTREELTIDMEDPYYSTGGTAEAAELAMGRYLVEMYGLVKAEQSMGKDGAARWALDKAKQIFGRTIPVNEPIFDEVHYTWRMEVPRSAIVGIGIRSAD
jgi:SAM-dependent methyltransferase